MKKLFLGFAVVAALASCSKNEVIDNHDMNGIDNPNRISFQTTTGAATRGAAVEIGDLEVNGTQFEVFCVSNFGEAAEANFFNGHVSNMYKYTDANIQKWDWVDATGKDWPEGATATLYPLQFFAAHPAPSVAMSWNNAIRTVTPAAKVVDQVDQLAATVPVPAKPLSGTAPMDFKHILSAIQFKLMSSDNYTVKIKDLSIVNVVAAREYDFANGAWQTLYTNNTTEYPYFKSTAAKSTQTLTFGATAVALDIKSGEFGDVDIVDAKQMMLVPQEMDAIVESDFKAAADAWVADGKKKNDWPTTAAEAALKTGAYLQVTYNMYDGTKYIVGHEGQYVSVFFPLDLTSTNSKQWDESKRYTYTLYLGTDDSSNGTVLDPEHKGEDGNKDGTDLDNPAVDPGNPITKGKITFTVGVTSWTNVDGPDIK